MTVTIDKRERLSRCLACAIAFLHFPVVYLHVACEFNGLALMWFTFGLAITIEIYKSESKWSQRIVDSSFNFTKIVVGLYTVGLMCWTYVWIRFVS